MARSFVFALGLIVLVACGTATRVDSTEGAAAAPIQSRSTSSSAAAGSEALRGNPPTSCGDSRILGQVRQEQKQCAASFAFPARAHEPCGKAACCRVALRLGVPQLCGYMSPQDREALQRGDWSVVNVPQPKTCSEEPTLLKLARDEQKQCMSAFASPGGVREACGKAACCRVGLRFGLPRFCDYLAPEDRDALEAGNWSAISVQ